MRKTGLCLGVAAFAGVFQGAACHQDDPPVPGLEDVVYEGGTNDEALAAFGSLPPKSPSKPFGFTLPTAGARLPPTPIPTFAWGDATPILDAGTGLFAPPRSPPDVPIHWLGGRAAFAHGAAFNGRAYLLRFAVPASDKLVRVFTARTTYTPGADAWKKLVDAKATITITIQSALFDNNAIAQQGGPFDGTSVAFTIGP